MPTKERIIGDNFTLLDRPRLNEDTERKKKTGQRWYITPRGVSLPSVTTVLKVIPNPYLDRWLKNNERQSFVSWVVKNRGVLNMTRPDGEYVLPEDGLEGMLKALNFYDPTAALTGNLVHNIFEQLLLGREPHIPEGWEVVRQLFERFAGEYEFEVLAVEPQLINYTLGYAGSADAVLRIRKRGTDEPWRVLVIDWKSGNGLYGSVARQLCMYAKMTHMIDPLTGEEIEIPWQVDGTAGVWLRPSGYALYPMKYDESVWVQCRAAKVIFDGMHNEWDLRGKPDNPNPIKSKGPAWPALPKEAA